jgi:hypothetical protein
MDEEARQGFPERPPGDPQTLKLYHPLSCRSTTRCDHRQNPPFLYGISGMLSYQPLGY